MSLLEPFASILFSPTTLSGAFAVLLFLYLVSSNFTSQQVEKEPPGPRSLPLLGNLLQLDVKRPYESLCEISKEYGSVFTIYMGTQKVVVLAGYKTVKEALVNYTEEFGDRGISPIFYDLNQGHGIIFSNGDSWKEMRRFAIATLRNLGMGSRVAEDKIIDECSYLIQVFEKHQGKPFETARPVTYAVSNIISSVLYGGRFEYDDPIFINMVERTFELIGLSASKSVKFYNMFPQLAGWIKNRKQLLKNAGMNVKDVENFAKDLQETLSPNIYQGFLDSFLIRKQKEEDSHVKDTHFTEKNMIFSVINLFVAGTNTTSATLKWALLFMARYPQIQDQVHEELSRMVGSRQVRVSDRINLPYTNAVIHETQRMANIFPMSIPHKTSQDFTFQGYSIKKGTSVIPLLASVLYDENEWESPHTFNPSHFLDEDGKFIKRAAFLPFSAGCRACFGEGLAKMELFLLFTSLLQHFQFTPPPGVREDELDLTPVLGVILSPSHHELCAISRH